ncbi:unnamed protein product [Soboliphyme baturini]|uniref:Transmembrane protein n=1 Tax=Soboliphyme baturini TaxID=241478 RepID=A0A183IY51_9BILA|nr:unnamed protein product [Soboliphyme baturini]
MNNMETECMNINSSNLTVKILEWKAVASWKWIDGQMPVFVQLILSLLAIVNRDYAKPVAM